MPYIYLVISVFMNASSSVFGKFFGKDSENVKDASRLYNFVQLAVAFCVWLILYAFNYTFSWSVLPYSILFAICFIVCNVGIINALNHGPMMLTSLLTSLSLIATTIWGFLFWDTEITSIVIIGLILVVIAIYLCLYTGKAEQKKISWKWLLFALMAFFGNAGCSIVQRTQQIQFNGQHKYMLMTFAMLLSAIGCFVIYLFGDKTGHKSMLKKTCAYPISAGACNVLLNLFVMLLATSVLSPSLIYPVIGVGGLMVVTLFSLFVFKEKLKWQQWLGIGVGAIATVLLSI